MLHFISNGLKKDQELWHGCEKLSNCLETFDLMRIAMSCKEDIMYRGTF